MTKAGADAYELADQASALIGWRVQSVAPVRQGGNNRVFQLIGKEQRALLKFYAAPEPGRQDRLAQEYAALKFLAELGFGEVARPIAAAPERHCAVYEWIDGTSISPDRMGEAEVEELADFFIRVQQVRGRAGADALADASASCFSPAMIAEQVNARLDRLAGVISSGTDIGAFVADSLKPAAATAIDRLWTGCATGGISFDGLLPRKLQVLSPSDFGVHNALRRPNGRLAFVDFEYFGWDDPAKAIADVMLHPGMSLTARLGHRYRARVAQALQASDPMLPLRLELFLPAVVVLWCLILLNEFLPERWARRALAGVSDGREIVQARQLQKAQQLLSRRFAG